MDKTLKGATARCVFCAADCTQSAHTTSPAVVSVAVSVANITKSVDVFDAPQQLDSLVCNTCQQSHPNRVTPRRRFSDQRISKRPPSPPGYPSFSNWFSKCTRLTRDGQGCITVWDELHAWVCGWASPLYCPTVPADCVKFHNHYHAGPNRVSMDSRKCCWGL